MTLVLNGTTGVSAVDGSASTPAIQGNDTNTGVFFPAADTVAVATGGSERVRVDSSGNVGVGTSSPAVRVHAMSAASSVSFALSPSSSNTNIGYITNDSTYLLFGSGYGSTGQKFRVALSAPDNSATIDSSGNLLVGTTDAAPRNLTSGSGARIGPAGQLELAGASSTNFINITAASGTLLEFRRQGPNAVGSITTNGTSTTYGTSSDYRLKEAITPMQGALARVAALKPVTYKWKANGSDGEGFIAHELAEVCPDAVQGEKDAVDAEGNPVYQGIDTSFLVATLTAAIQELNAKVESLTAEIATLKGAQA